MTLKKKYSALKRIGVILLLFIAGFIIYAMIANRNSKNMTNRQKVLKALYPAMMWITKVTGSNSASLSNKKTGPVVTLYNIRVESIDNSAFTLNNVRGKKILFVNTASDCGYTGQYEALEKLYREHHDKLVILGFPANDFKEQEKDTDANIASFCKANYGVTFPLMKKSSVIKGSGQNEVFQWLTDKNKNGWNDQAPTWNFCKYLVDENGKLTHFFASSVDPMSEEVLKAIEE